MTDAKRRLLYRVLLGTAIALYVWGLGALWFAHEWNIPESQFFLVGVLPVVTGVILMVGAIRLHVELVEDDLVEDAADDSEASNGTPPAS